MPDRAIAAIGLFTLFAATASAQMATTTSLIGTVTDPTGKSVQGANVTAVETGTADTRSTTTGEHGYYSFDFGRVGVYNIRWSNPALRKPLKRPYNSSWAPRCPQHHGQVRRFADWPPTGCCLILGNPSATINTSSFGNLRARAAPAHDSVGVKLVS